MPVVAMPWTICRWKTRNTATSGRNPSTEEAMTSAYWMLLGLTSEARPTGMVCDLVWLSTSNGHRKAFQEVMNVRMATVATAGRQMGTATVAYTRHQLAPSIRAASISGIGMPRKKAWKTNTDTGATADGSTSAQYVPSRCSDRYSMNCGSTSASLGSIRPAVTSAIAAARPRKRRKTSANAAIEHSTTVNSTE